MGDNASGHSFSLIAPAEDRGHAAILSSLNTKFDNVLIDGRLLREAQERVNLATKIVEVSEVEQHAQQNNRWFEEQAREAGLDLDDDMLEEGMGQGPRDRSKVQDAKSARARLSILLAQPLRTQRHGKFLSTNSSAPLEMQQIKPVGGH
jgi:ATP-dependent RNA helicase DDX24/MAK5